MSFDFSARVRLLPSGARRRLEPLVASGLAVCARCGEPIEAGAAWDLDHSDDRSGYLAPSHLKCNRGHGGPPWAALVAGVVVNPGRFYPNITTQRRFRLTVNGVQEGSGTSGRLAVDYPGGTTVRSQISRSS